MEVHIASFFHFETCKIIILVVLLVSGYLYRVVANGQFINFQFFQFFLQIKMSKDLFS